MSGGLHQAPADFMRRLRSETGIEDLQLELDYDESEKRGGPVWGVWTLQRGYPHLICQWSHPLDGNLTGLASLISRHDYSKNGGRKAFESSILGRVEAREKEKRRKFKDWSRGVAEYSRDAFRKLAYGEE